jgi:hypothetical protein
LPLGLSFPSLIRISLNLDDLSPKLNRVIEGLLYYRLIRDKVAKKIRYSLWLKWLRDERSLAHLISPPFLSIVLSQVDITSHLYPESLLRSHAESPRPLHTTPSTILGPLLSLCPTHPVLQPNYSFYIVTRVAPAKRLGWQSRGIHLPSRENSLPSAWILWSTQLYVTFRYPNDGGRKFPLNIHCSEKPGRRINGQWFYTVMSLPAP